MNLNSDNKSKKVTLKIDEHSFKYLFETLYTELCRYCMKFVRNEDTAEDIVQKQFIQLWEKRKTLEIHWSYKSYLYTAVKNRCLDFLKSKFARLTFEADINIEIMDNYNAQEHLECKELETIINFALKKLPEKCYVIFSLSRFEGLSNKKIAENLNISVRTVENQLSIALKRIRIFIHENWP